MTPQNRSTVSAFIICCNEERQIRRCLESITWCDEIVVVDSGSTDRTLDICREFTDKVVHRSWEGYISQKSYALSLCKSEWILNIDADEEVSPELARELQELLERDARSRLSTNGFLLNRAVYFLNRWWRKGGWYPEYRLRFCRRSATSWSGEEPHEKAAVVGKTARCQGELYHYTFSDIADYVRRTNTLSSNATATLLRKGVRPSLINIIGRPIARFIKFYILKQGFREGVAGLIVAAIEAFGVMLKYAKLWEARHASQKPEDALQ